MSSNPIIDLMFSNGIGVILLVSSGVRYHNQAGGSACRQPTAEGVYVPLWEETIDQEGMLHEHFFEGPKWQGGCMNGIDMEDADIIDQVLDRSLHTRYIKVDRTRLKESYEAWIFVDVLTQPDGNAKSSSADIPDFLMAGFGACKGVLVWANSD